MLTVEELEKAEALKTLVFSLVVPSEAEISTWKKSDFDKSALNVCYGGVLTNGKSGTEKSWYEVEIKIDGHNDLPPEEEWFYIITDDGYGFKARFIGDTVKTLSSFEGPEIIGKWIKGRLSDSGLIFSFQDARQDVHRIGLITEEVLKRYGGNQLILKKTNKTRKDRKGVRNDVWFLSFPSNINLDH